MLADVLTAYNTHLSLTCGKCKASAEEWAGSVASEQPAWALVLLAGSAVVPSLTATRVAWASGFGVWPPRRGAAGRRTRRCT